MSYCPGRMQPMSDCSTKQIKNLKNRRNKHSDLFLLVFPACTSQLKAENKETWVIEDVICRHHLPRAMGRKDKGERWIGGSNEK